MPRYLSSFLAVSVLALGACANKEETGGEAASFDTSAARAERDRLKVQIAGEVARQVEQATSALGNANFQSLPAAWNAYVQKTRTVMESTERCRSTNSMFPNICEPGRYLQYLANAAQLGFFGSGAVGSDVVRIVGNGGAGVIQLLDLIFIRVFIGSAATVAVDTRFRWIEELSALQYNVANDVQKFMCSNKSFNRDMCLQSSSDRERILGLENRVKQLEARLGERPSGPSCFWYKAAPGVSEVYLFDHGTTGQSIGAVGASAGQRTTYFANSGQYPSTSSRWHVRVINSASTMNNKLGYINKSQVDVAPEKCK